ncbi:hypothetical protein FACS1894199_03360 [Bacteroidia bacterium]|nr:hypothetical protein FACS1894199_03360 [Bacteroidia bacterium]
MKVLSKCFLAICILSGFNACEEEIVQEYSVLPEPQQIEYASGKFKVKDGISIAFPHELANEAAYCRDAINRLFTTVNPVLKEGKKTADIILVLDAAVLPEQPEGYVLDVKKKQIIIKANAPAGILYGIQTLRQLLGATSASSGQAVETRRATSLQCGTITDYPAFAWRGLMLDESSLFRGKEGLFKLLDNLAELKMNVLGWHLTDMPAWRIEIKKYPELTKNPTHDKKIAQRDSINKKGSFYTQEDVKEVVAYAAARNITVVPEIEMPAHGNSAIEVFPWLGVAKNVGEKTPDNLVSNYISDMTDPKVIEFFQNVLTEVMDLFPSKFIHIGGDEVEYHYWKDAPYIKQYMKEKGIKTPADLQVEFTNKIAQFAASKGRRVIGWNEINGANIHNEKVEDHITERHLDPGIIVQYWHGDISFAKKAIEDGNDIINASTRHAYLDYTYKQISLEKAYLFNPIPEGLTVAQQKKVLGLSASMWTWQCPDDNAVNHQIYPRIAALAEVGWTAPDKKDYKRFLKALDYFLTDWKKQGIEYGGY